MLAEAGYEVAYTSIIPDEKELISAELLKCADDMKLGLVVTTGGTGFSPRDVTPEATLSVVERETRGIPEAMRAASMRITPAGCLSRAAAGIRGRTLIVNVPGSRKAAVENLEAVLHAVGHGMDMLYSAGSADCAAPETKKPSPSMDAWLKAAKAEQAAGNIGMFLIHNGTVRETARSAVREGAKDTKPVHGMEFSYDPQKVDAAIEEAKTLPGISYIKVWLNEGVLSAGDDIMYVLVGGDIRPNVISALEHLVGRIKTECVVEKELY
jgi:molybdenum cofactor synthesis domain-containing protein